ncbi:MAG TPA: glycerol-3-phosphate acyltransferase [Anaerolineales bacterium]|nr:glycerol-3-phosphate acyltransferase [Anaerolineales bacterium]
MNNVWIIFLPVLGYMAGSLPFSIWITRYVKQVDVRESGSGHATTTNTIRQAGFGWGALVLILDMAKGFLPTYLAMHIRQVDSSYSQGILLYIVPLTAAAAVAGHCWPLFAQFRGGMGLATFGGSLLAVNWLAMLLGLGLLLSLLLLLRHGARASVLTGILISPFFWLLNLRGMEFRIAVACGLVIAYRFLIDWNRQYRELWLDREKE